RALGARVYPAAAAEVGIDEVSLTGAAGSDALFAGLPDPLPCFQWHGDTFDLPPGATLLASSPVCCNQAFRVGEGAWGLQCHVEVTPEMADEWGAIPAYCAALDGPVAALRAELATHAEELGSVCERLFASFVAVVTERAPAAR